MGFDENAWMPYETHLDVVREVVGERDRARRLAAHLEEIAHARTEVLRALVLWHRQEFDPAEYPQRAHRVNQIAEWAHAQLAEIP